MVINPTLLNYQIMADEGKFELVMYHNGKRTFYYEKNLLLGTVNAFWVTLSWFPLNTKNTFHSLHVHRIFETLRWHLLGSWKPILSWSLLNSLTDCTVHDVKYIWNNSFLNCGCRWKWRMIIAVNFPIYKQLERRRLKKFRASTGFEPVSSALPDPVEALIFFRLLLSNCL